MSTSEPPAKPARSDAIDLMRGSVMALMALDHARDFFGSSLGSPTDLTTTTPALFFTRWITHFCAPVFVLLAGTAAFMSGTRGRSKPEMTRFLLSRGLWLVLLELTVVRFGWMFNLDYRFVLLQVIWAIGWSMVALSLLCRLPSWAVGAVGLAICMGHDLLDGLHPQVALWHILHEPALLNLGGAKIEVVYPILPWVGVMAVGYALGEWMLLDRAARRKRLAITGASAIALFAVLRGTNLYGNPTPWVSQHGFALTVMSVLDCQKYPPSLAFLLMTLGPALCVLAWADGPALRGLRVRAQLVSFGRVPLFYYVLHLPLLHAMAAVLRMARGPELAVGLGGVYLAWVLAVALMALPCRWFAGVKQRSRHWWLSYL